MYKKQMLPNQVQAFRAAVARHVAVGDKTVSYNDVVTAQQTLASVISGYLTVLSDQWRAVVDIAHLTQTLDLFQVQVMDDAAPIAEVQELFHPRPRFRR
jgi:outer membrane protein TolC